MPEYPLCIDVYGDAVHVAEYKTRHPLDDVNYQKWMNESRDAILAVFNIPLSHLYLKQRERQRGIRQYEKFNEKKELIPVQEYGLTFWVNLQDYLDTGLFLDHRLTRKRVREESKDKDILNLFAYTGSFSVYAAAGGAKSTTTVDLSNTYLNWAKENFAANQIPLSNHAFIKTDAKEWIKKMPGKLFDIIILDPPTASKSKMAATQFDVQTDHVDLINHTLKHLKPDGCLYFSTNFRGFKMDRDKINAETINDISLSTIPQDFRNKIIHYCWHIQR